MHHERIPHDYYPTPLWVTRQFVQEVHLELQPGTVAYDPAAGGGQLLEGLPKNWYGFGSELQPTLCDLAQARGHAVWQRDYLSPEPSHLDTHTVDIWITNPPYKGNLAYKFASKMCRQARHGAYVALLVRQAFVAGSTFAEFLAAHPAQLHILPNRPAFRSDTGGAGKYDYAWWVHRVGYRANTWRRLPIVPKKDRV